MDYNSFSMETLPTCINATVFKSKASFEKRHTYTNGMAQPRYSNVDKGAGIILALQKIVLLDLLVLIYAFDLVMALPHRFDRILQ